LPRQELSPRLKTPTKRIRPADERLLREALLRVPVEHRMLLELSFWDELSGPEIARALCIPEQTVRSRLRGCATRRHGNAFELRWLCRRGM
jgi:DNA-directed RNA polymerase specialized sigma24 family protein